MSGFLSMNGLLMCLEPIEELEMEQQRLIDDLQTVERQCQKFVQMNDYKLKQMAASGSSNSEFLVFEQTQKVG